MSKHASLRWADMIHPPIPPSKFFGCHPGYFPAYRRALKHSHNMTERADAMTGSRIPISEFVDPRHPETVLIPRNRPLLAVDHLDDPVAPRLNCFFSSYDFWIDQDEHPLWRALHHPALFRMQGISQLGALIPDFLEEAEYLAFVTMPFHHSRWSHLMLAAAMDDVILARAGYPLAERAAHVLTVGTHDIALPAGGDTVKRIDHPQLDEEKAYRASMDLWDLTTPWQRQFGFDIGLADSWVHNQGMLGQLLDIVDKLSYVSLDCYYVGYATTGWVRSWATAFPLVMDVWQDLRISTDRTKVGFIDPDRLFLFLMLRALEHSELLLNPASRFLDTHVARFVQPLYQRNQITPTQLRRWTDDQLIMFLEQQYPKKEITMQWVQPAHYAWRRFDTIREREEFMVQCGHSIDHTEDRHGFNTGVNWEIFTDSQLRTTKPLHACLDRRLIERLLDESRRIAGYYAYWKRPDV